MAPRPAAGARAQTRLRPSAYCSSLKRAAVARPLKTARRDRARQEKSGARRRREPEPEQARAGTAVPALDTRHRRVRRRSLARFTSLPVDLSQASPSTRVQRPTCCVIAGPLQPRADVVGGRPAIDESVARIGQAPILQNIRRRISRRNTRALIRPGDYIHIRRLFDLQSTRPPARRK